MNPTSELPKSLPRVVLASASPRRRELLGALGLDVEIRPADLDETPRPRESPRDLVIRLAQEKADAVVGRGELAIAADTIVVIDGEILGKPIDPADACRALARIAGRVHEVWTGVALVELAGDGGRRTVADADRTLVRMASLTSEEIAEYVATGEPLDKAGSYAIQGVGALHVEAIDGNYSNVVGLPLPLVRRLFARLDRDLRGFLSPRATRP